MVPSEGGRVIKMIGIGGSGGIYTLGSVLSSGPGISVRSVTESPLPLQMVNY
ncbi:hypothetical protein [Candidatus Cardinium hertigii]|uniref:hypothetical protein n=1 Tax=Candidatus Cardinium hertigii TaxID=247481 RepID=UPI0013A540FB|nr:hypothetical protein [Candidatus Cardinium hertigii]